MCARPKKQSARKKPFNKTASKSASSSPQEKKAFLEHYHRLDFERAKRFADDLVHRYPRDAFGWKVLGSCRHKLGEIEASRQALEQSLALEGDDAQTQHLMARALYDLGEPEKALQYARKSVLLEPTFAQGHMTLAEILKENDRDEEALKHASRAQQHGHSLTACLFIQSSLFSKRRRYAEAFDTVHELIQHAPDNPYARNDAGNLYRDLGRFEEAEAAFRKALALNPDLDTAFFNLLLTLHYNPAIEASAIRDAISSWERDLAGPIERFTHRPDPQATRRRLRLGFVSPGFRVHPVGNMIQPALAELGETFELHFYSTNNADDPLTKRLKQCATGWHLVRHLDQRALAGRIFDDGIDILFDLSGFGEGSRLRTMAHKPAPIVIKWVGGLINTMGVSAYDYLLSDQHETPEGVDEAYSEKLIRMPDDYICYLPAPDAPPITSLPAMKNGYITLGCFNNPAKINPELLAQWAELMHALPESRLFLKSGQYDNAEYANNIRTMMAEHGIAEERLILEGPSPHRELLEAYNRVDIALDTWPYSGGLTTCEAFMMGVPVVTLPGPTFAGRHSATHLINAGMPELVTGSWDEYRQRVIELASDIPNLSLIRACLRQFLVQSPVCDAKKFSGHFSDAMRAIWQRYCDGKASAALTIDSEGKLFFASESEPVELASCQPETISTHVENEPAALPTRPHMSTDELELFERALDSTSRYFEFGAGGSTALAIEKGLEVHGVESDPEWVERLKNVHGASCQIQWCDIGPTGAWGVPEGTTHRAQFPEYSRAISARGVAYDLILVDGRFRVACVLSAVKHVLAYGPLDARIFVHDFWNRPAYHVVLMFLDHVESRSSAGLFRVRQDIDTALLDSILTRYLYESA